MKEFYFKYKVDNTEMTTLVRSESLNTAMIFFANYMINIQAVYNISEVLPSEKLKQQSQQEDNDIKSYGLLTKALRESRSERFIEDWLPVLQTKYVITEHNFKYTVETQDFGILDFFPKANKLLIRKDNRWIKPGLKWLINNL